MNSLAESELDDAEDLVSEDVPELNPVVWEHGSVQLSTIQEPVTVRGWPMGLALAGAPSVTISLTATGFQKVLSVMASLNLPSRRGGYKVETNQYKQGLASIRAQPRVRTHLHLFRKILNISLMKVCHAVVFLHTGIHKAALPAISTSVR